MLTRLRTWSTLKAWGLKLAAKRGHKRAVVAVARKLAAITHRMWLDGSEFRFAATGQEIFDPETGEVLTARAG
jgi:transposase